MFLVSCNEIVKPKHRRLFRFSLVLHASNLPEGRGWSPHIWNIINGKDCLIVSLINADDPVDTGDIWKQEKIDLDGSELYDEINSKLFQAEINLINWACENIEKSKPKKQKDSPESYFEKRSPKDSELNVDKTIRSQFNLMRTCDPQRFPAFFKIKGKTYKLIVEKFDEK